MVSTSLARANRVGFCFWRCDTKKFCYYPPPPPPRVNRDGFFLEITENFCYYPPPTESGRLLEITENVSYYPPPVSCCAPPRLPAPDPPRGFIVRFTWINLSLMKQNIGGARVPLTDFRYNGFIQNSTQLLPRVF